MLESVITTIVYAAGAYLAIGALASIALHARGLRILDRGTVDASLLFRVVITPGLIALWPLMIGKWRKAARGVDAAGKPDAPLRAMQLRRMHGFAARGLAVLLPIAIGTAVVARQPVYIAVTAGPLKEVAPLARVVSDSADAFGALPIVLRLRAGDENSWQIELDVSRDLARPAMGLYWAANSDAELLPGSGIYLGNVWGPGARRFAVTHETVQAGGTLLLYSFVDAEVIARAAVKAPPPP